MNRAKNNTRELKDQGFCVGFRAWGKAWGLEVRLTLQKLGVRHST